MPRFSIVVPAYNAEPTLAETLDSIMAQEFVDWECIVVDDGSTDGTATLAHMFAEREPRIRVVSQPNGGTAAAYNAGAGSARGSLVTMCSADDLLRRDHLSTMAAFIAENPTFDIYSCNGQYVFPDGHTEAVYQTAEWSIAKSVTLAQLATACFFSVGATFRADLFREVGGFTVGVYGEDYDFWLRALASGATHRYSPAMTAVHRVSEFQKSASLDRVVASDIETLERLVRGSVLSNADRAAVEHAIATRRQRHEEIRITAAVTSGLLKVLGPTLGGRCVSAIRRAGRVSHPAKVALAKRMSRTRS